MSVAVRQGRVLQKKRKKEHCRIYEMLYNSFDTLWPLNLILLIQTNILSSVKFLQLTVVFDEWKGTSTQGMVRGTQCRQMTDILTEPRLDRRKGERQTRKGGPVSLRNKKSVKRRERQS